MLLKDQERSILSGSFEGLKSLMMPRVLTDFQVKESDIFQRVLLAARKVNHNEALYILLKSPSYLYRCITEQKMKFSIKDFFSKCDEIRRKLWIWLHLLKKCFIENFFFCAVSVSLLVLHIINHYVYARRHLSIFGNHIFIYMVEIID